MRSMPDHEVTTILIVDDEPDLCEMLEFEFSARGYRAFSAFDGEKALELLRMENIAAIISDVRMPFLDGVALLEQVKAGNPASPIVILMSAYADLSLEEAYRRGAEAFFLKPFHLADLAEKVQHLLLPAEDRWGRAPAEPAPALLTRQYTGCNADGPLNGFALGRGGFAMNQVRQPMLAGARLRFQLDFETGPIPAIEGEGILRWIQASEAHPDAFSLGVEFSYLHEAHRAAICAWQATQAPKAFIPILDQI